MYSFCFDSRDSCLEQVLWEIELILLCTSNWLFAHRYTDRAVDISSYVSKHIKYYLLPYSSCPSPRSVPYIWSNLGYIRSHGGQKLPLS
jgi:hypothetical protein